MTDLKEVYQLLQSCTSAEVTIKYNNKTKSITFTKDKISYHVYININHDKLEFSPVTIDDPDDTFLSIFLNKSKFKDPNQITELVTYIKTENLHSFCVVCCDRLEFQSDIYMPCEKDKCIYKFEEMIIGNPVTEKFKSDPDICSFLIESAIDAMTCPRKYDIFEPFPSHFLIDQNLHISRGEMSKLQGQNYDNNKNFALIDKTIENFKIEDLLKYLTVHKKDSDLAKIIGKDLYLLLRFILMSCKVTVESNDDVLDIKGQGYKIYKIVHPFDKDEEFKELTRKTAASYLFHGSRWCNWYSILRNGLKNCSGSKLMTAGQAYGSGIYLSDNVQLSYNYGISGHTSVVGVFEIIDKDKYYKGPQVFVCDNDKDVIQRYLMILKDHKAVAEINKTFNNTIYEKKSTAAIKYNQKSIKKIIREYKDLMKMKQEGSSFRIEVNPDFPFEWKIFMYGFDKDAPITQDMETFGIKEIELEIKFPQNYPFSPPFLRVVRPRFAYQTGHITASGAFCSEILTEKGWVPTCTTESLIVYIICQMTTGGGRIDPQKYNIPYSEEEAHASFVRVARSHGWM